MSVAREDDVTAEAVAVAVETVGQHRVALARFDFQHRGGTLGVAVGDRLVALAEAARTERLPLLLIVRTGGVRVHEGPAALAQMPRVAHALDQHRQSGLLQLAILRDPSFGGVLAGFALSADVILATPGARVGFLGPAVVRSLGHSAAQGSGEGIADAVVAEEDQLLWVERLLDLLSGTPGAADSVRVGPTDLGDAADSIVRVDGERRGLPGPGSSCGFANVDGKAFAWAAMSERDDPGPPGPEAFSKIRRHLRLAERLGLPVVAVVATLGADTSTAADQRNVAGEIAATTSCLASLAVPTMTLVCGMATSGGAMSLMGSDRVIVDLRATVDVLPTAAVAALSGLSDPPRASAADVVADAVADKAVDLSNTVNVRRALVELVNDVAVGERADRWARCAERWHARQR